MEHPPERPDRALDLVALSAIAAISGVIGRLPITLPAATLVLAAMSANVAAGAVLVAFARRHPFTSLAEAALAGLAGAIALDAVLCSSWVDRAGSRRASGSRRNGPRTLSDPERIPAPGRIIPPASLAGGHTIAHHQGRA